MASQQVAASSSITQAQLAQLRAQITERWEMGYTAFKLYVDSANAILQVESNAVQDRITGVETDLQTAKKAVQNVFDDIQNGIQASFKLVENDISAIQKRMTTLEDRVRSLESEGLGEGIARSDQTREKVGVAGSAAPPPAAAPDLHVYERLGRLEAFKNQGYRGHVAAMGAKFEKHLSEHKKVILESLDDNKDLVFSKDENVFELEKKVSDLTREQNHNIEMIGELEKKVSVLAQDQNRYIGTIGDLAGRVQTLETRLAAEAEKRQKLETEFAEFRRAMAGSSEASAKSQDQLQHTSTATGTNKRKRQADVKDPEAKVKTEAAPVRKRARAAIDPDVPLPSIEEAPKDDTAQPIRIQPARAMKGERRAWS